MNTEITCLSNRSTDNCRLTLAKIAKLNCPFFEAVLLCHACLHDLLLLFFFILSLSVDVSIFAVLSCLCFNVCFEHFEYVFRVSFILFVYDGFIKKNREEKKWVKHTWE